tara:strand:- start:313 stop:555 length:243 start_codon:yes stop_codon:yes gene_type:complete
MFLRRASGRALRKRVRLRLPPAEILQKLRLEKKVLAMRPVLLLAARQTAPKVVDPVARVPVDLKAQEGVRVARALVVDGN